MGIFDKLFVKKSKDLEVKNIGIEKGEVKKISDGLNPFSNFQFRYSI